MAELLSNLSEALAGVVEAAGQGVVQVEGRRRLPASGVLWSTDGLIVTAHHVLEQDGKIGVGLPDGKAVTATIVGRDPTTDVALLQAKAQDLKPAGQATPDGLRVGHLVLALGRPGRTVQATLGIVSALGDSWRTPAGGLIDRYLQTDVTMYPGFSGGPLVDVEGQILGLNTSALLRGTSLVVPVPTLRDVVEALQAHGRIRRGYLGVGAQLVRLPAAAAEQLGQETALLVVSVNPGSPADKAGLVLGDVIASVAGQAVRHMDDLLSLLTGDRIGSAVPVRIVRGGQIQELSVTIGERE
jgi:S1-C subfamily serine protease